MFVQGDEVQLGAAGHGDDEAVEAVAPPVPGPAGQGRRAGTHDMRDTRHVPARETSQPPRAGGGRRTARRTGRAAQEVGSGPTIARDRTRSAPGG